MDISRRKLLGNAVTFAAATAMVGQDLSDISSAFAKPNTSTPWKWHPLTRSLIERARRIDRAGNSPDRAVIERAIRQFAVALGHAGPLDIKWMATPTDAFDYLSRLGLDALLDMGTASFWRGAQLPLARDPGAFDRAFEVRMLANELLGVDETDQILMAPKLRAKSQAMSANGSDNCIFRVRAVSSQIGWLETSMADAAGQAVSDVRAASELRSVRKLGGDR